MRIAVVTSRYPTLENPYNHMFVHNRVLEMINQGCDVKVFVPANQREQYEIDNLSVICDKASKITELLTSFEVVYLHLLNIYPFQASNGWKIYHYLLNTNLNVALYVHGNEVQKYTSRFYEFNWSIKEFLKWIKKDLFVIPRMRSFVKKIMDRGGCVFIFPSQWMLKETERNLRLKIEKYEIIPNGVNLENFTFLNQVDKRFKLISIRSLSQKVYDIEFTIKMMKEMPDSFSLEIFGKGIYEKKYKTLISKLGLQKRVKIINKFFSRNELKDIFKEYGAFISTTKMDSQGITMMEAMASGLVLLTTDNSSKREFVEDLQTGILGKTPKELALKADLVLSDSKKYKLMALNGFKSLHDINNKKTVYNEIMVLRKLKSQHGI